MELTKTRYRTVDLLRGLAVLLMILYHALWDVVYILGVGLPWFTGNGGHIAQRSIRWMFILIAGFCFLKSKHSLRRGLVLLGLGGVVTLTTLLVIPDQPIHLGVLTFLGSALILSAALKKLLIRINPYAGIAGCIVLFLLTVNGESGYFRFCGIHIVQIPAWLYSNILTAWMGFPAPAFSSTDYVPVIPWIFAFWIGSFAFRVVERNCWHRPLTVIGWKPLEYIGRHALIIYLAHQPVLYGISIMLKTH